MSLSDVAPSRYIPAPQHCIGREEQIDEIARVLTERPNAQVSIFGGPGIGKGTIGVAVLNMMAVKDTFGNSVFLLRCDEVQNYHGFLRALGQEIDISCADTVSALASAILHFASSAPTLIFLDNAEVPLSGGEAHLVEGFVRSLSKVSSLALFVAVRSQIPPLPGHSWTLALPVKPLGHEASERVFHAYAGERFKNEHGLYQLLRQMGGVPLAIRLIALTARHGKSIDRILQLWEERGADTLVYRGGSSREDSLETALSVSLKHEWMSAVHRNVLAAVAFFPKGVARGLLEKERYTGFGEAINTLLDLGLLERRNEVLSLLLPVRDYITRHINLPEEIGVSLAISCWQWMEDRCKKIGGPNGSAVIGELAYFASNFEAALRYGLSSRVWKSACSGVSRYASAGKLGMFGDPSVCDLAVKRVSQEMLIGSEHVDDLHLLKGRMLRASGFQYEKAGLWTTAHERYLESLATVKDLELAEAETLRARLTKDIADVALASNQLDRAEEFYEKSKSLFLELKDYREAIECSIGSLEVKIAKDILFSPPQVQAIDAIIGEIKQSSDRANDGRWHPSQRDFTRTEAKAFLVKCRIVEPVNSDLAVNCAIKALNLYSASADVSGTVGVVERVVKLIIKTGRYERGAIYVASKLAGNPKHKSHRARSRRMSFLFYRAGKQAASQLEASICYSVADRLKGAGFLPSRNERA